MEELLGSLMTYEISLTKQLQESEDKKKKSIALKATTKEEEDVEEEKPSEEDDDLALITRKLNKYMRGERFRGKKFTSRRNSRRESSSHGDKDKWEEKGDLICFKCKKPGHIKYDCPLYKIEAKRRMKKAMMATWSESEESSEEEKEKEVANMCFMAIDDLDEVNSNSSDEDMHVIFEELYEDFEKLSLKNNSLKKRIQELEKELEEVKEKFSIDEISKTHLEKENEILRNENEILKKKNEWLTSSLSIFSCGQKSFEMILASQKCVFDKQGLGFKSSKNQKYFKNYFVKESSSECPSTICNFCGRGGHISSTCPLRNGAQKNSNAKVKKVWIEKSKVTNPQGPKKTWVPKPT